MALTIEMFFGNRSRQDRHRIIERDEQGHYPKLLDGAALVFFFADGEFCCHECANCPEAIEADEDPTDDWHIKRADLLHLYQDDEDGPPWCYSCSEEIKP